MIGYPPEAKPKKPSIDDARWSIDRAAEEAVISSARFQKEKERVAKEMLRAAKSALKTKRKAKEKPDQDFESDNKWFAGDAVDVPSPSAARRKRKKRRRKQIARALVQTLMRREEMAPNQ